MKQMLTFSHPAKLVCAECLGAGAVMQGQVIDACRLCAFQAEVEWLEERRLPNPEGASLVGHLRVIDGGRQVAAQSA